MTEWFEYKCENCGKKFKANWAMGCSVVCDECVVGDEK